jgi:hypothetical protein
MYNANFYRAAFKVGAIFEKAKFMLPGSADFKEVEFGRMAVFDEAEFLDVDFKGATFRTGGYATFRKAIFNNVADFHAIEFHGEYLTFRDAKFALPAIQEHACRRAKNVLASVGDRNEEEFHFYREMEAKRKQKGIQCDIFRVREWSQTDIEEKVNKRPFLFNVFKFILTDEITRMGMKEPLVHSSQKGRLSKLKQPIVDKLLQFERALGDTQRIEHINERSFIYNLFEFIFSDESKKKEMVNPFLRSTQKGRLSKIKYLSAYYIGIFLYTPGKYKQDKMVSALIYSTRNKKWADLKNFFYTMCLSIYSSKRFLDMAFIPIGYLSGGLLSL